MNEIVPQKGSELEPTVTVETPPEDTRAISQNKSALSKWNTIDAQNQEKWRTKNHGCNLLQHPESSGIPQENLSGAKKEALSINGFEIIVSYYPS